MRFMASSNVAAVMFLITVFPYSNVTTYCLPPDDHVVASRYSGFSKGGVVKSSLGPCCAR